MTSRQHHPDTLELKSDFAAHDSEPPTPRQVLSTCGRSSPRFHLHHTRKGSDRSSHLFFDHPSVLDVVPQRAPEALHSAREPSISEGLHLDAPFLGERGVLVARM